MLQKIQTRQIYTTLLLVTFSFLILSTPFYAVHLWVNFANGSGPQFIATYQFLYIATQALFFTNNGINFFLYVMSGKKFSTDLMNILSCIRQKQSQDGRTSGSAISVNPVCRTDCSNLSPWPPVFIRIGTLKLSFSFHNSSMPEWINYKLFFTFQFDLIITPSYVFNLLLL